MIMRKILALLVAGLLIGIISGFIGMMFAAFPEMNAPLWKGFLIGYFIPVSVALSVAIVENALLMYGRIMNYKR